MLCWHGVGLTNRGSLFLNEAGPQLAFDHDLRILALDAPGFGRSPPVEREAYHPHALADLVPPLLAALGLARAPFIGFSWGADIPDGARAGKRKTAASFPVGRPGSSRPSSTA